MSTDAIISAQNLTFGYEKTILDGISFSVRKGEFVAFVGPSGCGKTTLLYLLLGLRTGYSGTIRVDSGRASFVFQHGTLLEWRTALANVLLPFELAGEPVSDEVRRHATRTLELVGLGGYEEFFPNELSGGMKKRVEIARAIVTQPDLLILDEPFSSLDIITRERLNILVNNIHRQSKQTVVMVTHSVEEASFLSDTIFVLSNAPARITRVQPIDRGPRQRRDQFALNGPEQLADRAIRAEAKALWSIPESRPTPSTAATAHAVNSRAARSVPNAPEFTSPASAVSQTADSQSELVAVQTARGRDTESASVERILSRITRFVRRNYNRVLIPFEIAAAFGLLSAAKVLFKIPDYIFPAPAAIVRRFAITLFDGSILPHLGATFYESAVGFVAAFVITIVLGYAIAKSRVISNLAMPHLIALNTIPAVALAPFLVLWLGFGYPPKVVTAIILMFFPMLINNIAAIRTADERMATLVRFYHPSRLMTFIKFELPEAVPMIFSGIKVSITLSVIGAVVGEFVSGQDGLGALVNIAKANFDMELMYVGLIWLGLLGLAYYALASAVHALIMTRRKRNV